MTRDARYDILFDTVPIGPLTARNRFYQVPHCTGMGHAMPETVAAMRGVKAEGGWAVVCTEYCSVHPSSDDSPYAFCTLWDEDDVRNQVAMTDAVHAHGALAGVELWHGGLHSNNRLSRIAPMAPSSSAPHIIHPLQARAMDRSDIRNLRKWQVAAARRAKRAGFDIIYVYAGHDYLPFQFLSRRHNRRSDEYGGSLVNRVRLLREMIEDTREAVGDTCAVAVRLAIDELMDERGISSDGEGREIIAMLAELPDLWDVNVSGVANDSRSARFSDEGFQEECLRCVKTLTSKPVVGVGRYTSPDRMASLVKKGVLDFIGAARPSIADPFLPAKIEAGRIDDIRECIGCNICRSGNNEGAPIRCTQNPTMGEEWRRGWHPERIAPAGSASRLLVVGGGPAGLETARALGQRGYDVVLAEASDALGGRINRECRLPGLSTWARVRDWRLGQLNQMANVETYLASELDADHVVELAPDRIVLATGARWRRDGLGAHTPVAVPGHERGPVFTPDDLLTGKVPEHRILIYDDDHYYMGGALAEMLAQQGCEVSLATPLASASSWTEMTNEQHFVQARLIDVGVELLTDRVLERIEADRVVLSCRYTGREFVQHCASVVLVTMREPEDSLWQRLTERGLDNIQRIGDCYVPGAIVHAVHGGHQYARELDTDGPPTVRRERVVLSATAPTAKE